MPGGEEPAGGVKETGEREPRCGGQRREDLPADAHVAEPERGLRVVEGEPGLRADVALEIAAQLVVVPHHVACAGERQDEAARQHDHRDQLRADREPGEIAPDHCVLLVVTWRATRRSFELIFSPAREAASSFTSNLTRLSSTTNVMCAPASSAAFDSATTSTGMPRSAASQRCAWALSLRAMNRMWHSRAPSGVSGVTRTIGRPPVDSPVSVRASTASNPASASVQI